MKISKNRFGVIATLLAALVLSPITLASAADVLTFGKSCSSEGISTGTSTDSLICKSVNGKLVWQRVRLGANYGTPVKALRALKGTIEFHHWRPEDKVVLQSIIDKFRAANPGTTINQVIMSSVDYTNLAYAKITANKKAAVFVTSRGGQFDQFAKAGLLKEIGDQRYMKQNVIQSALTPATVGGRVYGLPYQ